MLKREFRVMPEIVEIDGSFGEGGGSIIRLAVALSAVTNKPCKITNIRAKRAKPGLQAQHSTAVSAVANLCGAGVKGNEIGSTEVEFHPEEIRGGPLSLNVGTAGSTALVMQALMIPAIHCEKLLDIKITGGTLNRWAPSIAYLQNVTMATMKRFGYNGEIKLLRHGFYPKGGGEIEAVISPSEIKPISLLTGGKLIAVKGTCTASMDLQKAQVAERMQKFARGKLFEALQVTPEIKAEYADAYSTGGGIDLFAVYENAVLGSSAIAERGKRAEDVAKEAVDELIEAHKSEAPVDKHLADQMIPYMALAGGAIKTAEITEHTRTNIWLCGKFLPVKFEIDRQQKVITCRV